MMAAVLFQFPHCFRDIGSAEDRLPGILRQDNSSTVQPLPSLSLPWIQVLSIKLSRLLTLPQKEKQTFQGYKRKCLRNLVDIPTRLTSEDMCGKGLR